jgi:prepilin signal peptidase PulO-like enzyme (type II secretory pathway)
MWRYVTNCEVPSQVFVSSERLRERRADSLLYALVDLCADELVAVTRAFFARLTWLEEDKAECASMRHHINARHMCVCDLQYVILYLIVYIYNMHRIQCDTFFLIVHTAFWDLITVFGSPKLVVPKDCFTLWFPLNYWYSLIHFDGVSGTEDSRMRRG